MINSCEGPELAEVRQKFEGLVKALQQTQVERMPRLLHFLIFELYCHDLGLLFQLIQQQDDIRNLKYFEKMVQECQVGQFIFRVPLLFLNSQGNF